MKKPTNFQQNWIYFQTTISFNILMTMCRSKKSNLIYSSSSSSAAPLDWPFFKFLRLTRPARPPPNGDFVEKSMCFCESNRTMNDGMLTTCLRTLKLKKKKSRLVFRFDYLAILEDWSLETIFFFYWVIFWPTSECIFQIIFMMRWLSYQNMLGQAFEDCKNISSYSKLH